MQMHARLIADDGPFKIPSIKIMIVSKKQMHNQPVYLFRILLQEN